MWWHRTGLAGRWRREPCEAARAATEAVDEALQVPPLQRLALARVTEMEIRETADALEARPPWPCFLWRTCVLLFVCLPVPQVQVFTFSTCGAARSQQFLFCQACAVGKA